MLQAFNLKRTCKVFLVSLSLFFIYGLSIVSTHIFIDKNALILIFCSASLAINYGITSNYMNLNKLNMLFFLSCSVLPLITKVTGSAWSVENQYGEYLLPFAWLIFVQLFYSILFLEKDNNLFLKLLATIPTVCFCTIQLLVALYFLATKALLDDFAILAVCQTNPAEALAFLKDYIPYWLLFVFALAFLSLIIFVWHIFSRYQSMRSPTFKNKLTLLLSFFMLADLYVAFMLCPKNFIQRTSYNVYHSLDTYKEFRELRNKTLVERENNFYDAKYIGTSTGTYVLIIGESETRDHMSAYGYARETTPWLTQEAKNNPYMLLFPHAYACDNATTKVLALALTEANQYNNVKLNNAMSIIDIAKKAGFETIWLSNQMRYGQFDSPTTIIAESTDKQIWTNSHVGMYTRTNKYDDVLLNELRKLGTSNQNRLIVVHLMGCHSTYTDRYPPQNTYFISTADVPTEVQDKLKYNTYDNTVRYNDFVLEQLCTIAKTDLKARAITYFSDHGDELVKGYGHNPLLEKYDYTLLRFPFFIDINTQEFTAPQLLENLHQHQTQYFTNDLVYDTMLGLMQIQTNRSNKKYDLTSPSFDLPLNSLKGTDKGYPIAKDPKL